MWWGVRLQVGGGRPYLCQVDCTATGAPHTCIRPVAHVGLATLAGQLSEAAATDRSFIKHRHKTEYLCFLCQSSRSLRHRPLPTTASKGHRPSTPAKYSSSVCCLQNHRHKPLAVNHAVALPNAKRRDARHNFPNLGPLLEPEVSVALEQRLCFTEFPKKPQCSHRSTIFVDASPEENDGFAIEDASHS
ncbi:hypothetical protein B296_00051221 [Ensete ventricosum]|uniref:Uncharacterized protein n=1 Tax=Ensete ventricosum TaxID=4639 RepID=A0A426X2V0_ENSVE|nr:hypothetical protein B296_00051221 [Ensete ventricosum]